MRSKFETPCQPEAISEETNLIELLDGHQFELALKDLGSFDTIWLIWWFDRNKDWKPTVLPPRGPATRRGVFATRSPHRPNPIGITCVRLISVHERSLTVGPLDLLDGTPILDIKPYLTTVDCHPGASLGWLEAVEQEERKPPKFKIDVSPKAELQIRWLKSEWNIDFTVRAFSLLTRDPTPNRTRRIIRMDDRFRLACGAWRLYFRVWQDVVIIDEVGKGYSDESLASDHEARFQDREAQIAFAHQRWEQP